MVELAGLALPGRGGQPLGGWVLAISGFSMFAPLAAGVGVAGGVLALIGRR
jgi:hypothetical protein